MSKGNWHARRQAQQAWTDQLRRRVGNGALTTCALMGGHSGRPKVRNRGRTDSSPTHPDHRYHVSERRAKAELLSFVSLRPLAVGLHAGTPMSCDRRL